MMNIEKLAHNKSISEFSSLTGIPVTTLRDWNKRGLAENIGQPGPNGHWLYSQWDAVSVEIASILHGSGLNWKTALTAGAAMSNHLLGRKMQPDQGYHQSNVFAFFGIEAQHQMHWGCGDTFDDAVKMARNNAGDFSILAPIAVVVDLAMIVGMLKVSVS